MLFVPRHPSFTNQTVRSTDSCPRNVTATQGWLLKLRYAIKLPLDFVEDPEYEPWHVIFWASPLFTGLFVSICFIIPCLVVSHFTESTEVDENLLIEIFQSPIYPSWIRKMFKIKSSEEDTVVINSRNEEIMTKSLWIISVNDSE